MTKDSGVSIDWDIRFFRRYPKAIDFSFNVQGRDFTARTVDYSLIGVGIVVDDISAPLTQGDSVFLNIDELDLHESGRVAWIQRTPSSLRVGILKTKPLRGSFVLYPLSDILIGLQRTLTTGILDVRHGGVNKKIYIKGGNVIFAVSNDRKDRLGDVLLRSRRINRKQYDKAAEIKQKTGGRYTAILVHMGYLKPRDVISAAELQAKRIMGSLFTMKDAEFAFIEGPLPSRDAITLNLSVSDLIYNVLKKNADVSLLENYLLDKVVDFSSNPLNLFQNIHFTASDRTLLSCVDGRTTIGDLIRLFPPGRVTPLKIIYALLEARFLKIKGVNDSPSGIRVSEILEPKGQPDNILNTEIDQLHSEYKKLDYYTLLDVDRRSTAEEIKRAYYRAARKYHPDMNLNIPEDMKKKLVDIFSSITAACLTLTDSAKRKQYDDLITSTERKNEKAGPVQGPAVSQKENEQNIEVPQPQREFSAAPDIAPLRFRDGKIAFWDKNYNDAARLFAAAISADRSAPEYHYYHGITLGILGKLKEAVRALNKANELKPMDADIIAELGHIYLKLNFPVRAKGFFDRAMKLSPSNDRARQGLKMMKGGKAR